MLHMDSPAHGVWDSCNIATKSHMKRVLQTMTLMSEHGLLWIVRGKPMDCRGHKT